MSSTTDDSLEENIAKYEAKINKRVKGGEKRGGTAKFV